MAKKITIQHLYNTGNTMPDVSKLEFGEIAICANAGNERIYTKNSDNTLAAFPSLDTVEALIDDATKGVITNANFSELQSQVETHINNTLASDAAATTRTYGHVVLVNSDLKDGENTNGAAAGLGHTHSQYQPKGDYLTGVTAGSGLAIVGIIENGDVELQLDSETNNKINSGVSGYTRIENHEPKSGTTEEIGHVKLVGGDLSGKTGNVTNGEAAASHHIHSQYIAKDEISNGLEIEGNGLNKKLSVKAKTDGGITVDASGVSIDTDLKGKWNDAADAINAFMNDNAAISGAVDTLKEINEYLTGTGTSVETLLKTLDDLTDTVDNNTSAITQNSNNISSLTTSASTNASNITVLDQTVTAINDKIGSGFTSGNTIASEIKNIKDGQSNFVTGIIGSGNINVTRENTGNRYTITHTTAGTQASATTATNSSTDLSFGSGFTIVDKIAYDANGHVVSGSTQTLKLPKITAQGGLTGATGTNADGDKGYVIGHTNSFGGWNGKSTGITLNFNESFKIPIIDYQEQDDREPNLSGVDVNGHLKDRGWTLTSFSLPNIISCGTY